jgi:hypothetical protein
MRYTKLSAFAFSAFMFYSITAFAASQQTTTDSPSGATGSGGTVLSGGNTSSPVRPRASLTFTCSNGKMFKISTGTGTGSCSANQDASGAIVGGECTINGSAVAYASCNLGCAGSEGRGSCAPVN